jgi:hypothetical protein
MEDSMISVKVKCPQGFNDHKILRGQRIPFGGIVEVPEYVYKQMKQSDPSVVLEDKKLELAPGALDRIREASKEAIEEIEEAVEDLEEVVEETEQEEKSGKGKKRKST